jgi:AdoMet-dependent heme synthase
MRMASDSDSGSDPYDLLLARLAGEYIPFNVLWELTHACNLRCVMCYNVRRSEPELTTAECLDVLRQLAAAGALQLTLTGGEILARRDFFTIAEAARALSFALYLKTNGTLITPARADRIAALAPVQVDISLLGATAATFDSVAGRRRVLRRVLAGVRLLQERGLRVKLNTLLLDLNIGERLAMVELARGLGVEYEQVFKVSPTDDAGIEAGAHQIACTQIAAALSEDNAAFEPRSLEPPARTCRVGLSSCLISPYGEVYPCVELRIPAGSLRGQPFDQLWRNAPILQELRARHTLQFLPECRGCPLRRYCEGRCAGLAWKERGDFYGGHTLACRQAQARYTQQHPGLPVPATPLVPGGDLLLQLSPRLNAP